MSRVLNGLVTSVAAARNLVVVHTPSGAAQYVASVIDKQSIEGVLGHHRRRRHRHGDLHQ